MSTGVSVPEAPVDKDGHPPRGKREIWAPGQASRMEYISIAKAMKSAPDH